jgi:hypothetical protein
LHGLFVRLTIAPETTSVRAMNRMRLITGWKRAALAAVMAYALVLQVLLISVSGAAHAAQASGPQGILCLQDGQSQSDHAPAKAHDGLCCLVGCHGAGAAGPVPVASSPVRRVAVVRDAPLPENLSAAPISSSVLPVGSRAPPRLG